MKTADFITMIAVAAVVCGFAFIPGAWEWFNTTTANHGLLMSFFKFAILCTFGEMLSMRIREGVYLKKGFGLMPRILVWGVIGVVIASAMIIFRTGTVRLLDGGFHLNGKASECFDVKNGVIPPLTWGRAGVALCVSTLMNTLFAPIFITFHKITDIHIEETGGTLKGFFSSPLNICEALSKKINWEIHYGFVIAKTIPFYAIPANTIVFLLPPTLQVLAAALVGITLGLVLSIKK